MTNGHHHNESDGSRQQTHHSEGNAHHPNSNRDSQKIPCGDRISQTRRMSVRNVVGADTGLGDVETNGCYSARYAERWVSEAPIAAYDREMASDLREASGGRTILPLQANWAN